MGIAIVALIVLVLIAIVAIPVVIRVLGEATSRNPNRSDSEGENRTEEPDKE